MPNWCEGTLKIRGTKENILDFLNKECKIVNFKGFLDEPSIQNIIAKEQEDEIEIFYPDNSKEIYLNNTRRNFIENYTGGYLNTCKNNDNEKILVIEGFKAAWGIENKPYVEWSKKYNIDFNIHGYEHGMCFEQEIEIIKGKLLKNEEITYDDYVWECPFPNLGG